MRVDGIEPSANAYRELFRRLLPLHGTLLMPYPVIAPPTELHPHKMVPPVGFEPTSAIKQTVLQTVAALQLCRVGIKMNESNCNLLSQ